MTGSWRTPTISSQTASVTISSTRSSGYQAKSVFAAATRSLTLLILMMTAPASLLCVSFESQAFSTRGNVSERATASSASRESTRSPRGTQIPAEASSRLACDSSRLSENPGRGNPGPGNIMSIADLRQAAPICTPAWAASSACRMPHNGTIPLFIRATPTSSGRLSGRLATTAVAAPVLSAARVIALTAGSQVSRLHRSSRGKSSTSIDRSNPQASIAL